MSEYDFEAALAAKVTPDEGQVAAEEVVEPVAEEAEAGEEEAVIEEERPRDEKGRFTALKSEDLPPDIQAYLDAHGGDAAAALKDAVEAQKVIGRQGSELGELRKQFEAFEAQQQKPRYDQSAFAQLIETDPAKATALAWEAGDQAAVSAALGVWKDEDPFQAAVWVNDVRNAEFQRQMAEQLQTSTAPLQERVEGQDFQEALTAFAQQNPDLDKYVGTMQALAPEMPIIMDILQNNPSPEGKLQAFKVLYNEARVRDTGRLAEQKEAIATEEAAAAEADKLGAAVASATSTVAAGGKSNIDIFKAEMLKPPAYREA